MTSTDSPPRAVLIVEHDRGVRTLLGRLVSQWGCTPLLAENEDRGVRLLGEASGIALVLSDFQAEATDETVYAHLIRRATAPVPPVLCTLPSARAAPEDVELLPRPFDVTLLRRIVNQYVHGVSDDSHAVSASASASAPRATPAGSPDPAASGDADSSAGNDGAAHDGGAGSPTG